MLSIRKIAVLGRTYRHLNRYRQILTILIRHGFGDLIEQLQIDQYIESGMRLFTKNGPPKPQERKSRARRFRMALEELGPTYIKLGQALSTRADLIPPDLMEELSRLQDHVPCSPFSDIRIILAESFPDHKTLFAEIDPIPIAAASIGQVHQGTLPDGDSVAVKIQRPGIQRMMEADLEIMLHLASLMERHIEEFALHEPARIVEEFARRLEREVDYRIEAGNMERFARQFLDESFVYVPRVYHHLTAERVLTMEYMEGIKISDLDRLDRFGADRKRLTRRGATLFLKQVFTHGYFHADPHPGNLFVLPGEVICLLDFGTMGMVDLRTREDFTDLLEGVVRRDPSRVLRSLLAITTWDQEPDQRALEREIGEFLELHLYKPLREICIGSLMQHLFEIVSRHRLRIPPDIFFMMKAFGTIEGIAHQLDPEFDMVSHAAPFLEAVKLSRYSPNRIRKDLLRASEEMIGFLQQFPADTLEIARIIRRGRLFVRHEDQGLERSLSAYNQMAEKLAFSVIIAALIIGSALIVIAGIPPLIYGISLIGILLFSAAAILGVWLLGAILWRRF